MAWVVIMLAGTVVLIAGFGGLYDGWLHRRPAGLVTWSDAERRHAKIMSRYYAQYGPTE